MRNGADHVTQAAFGVAATSASCANEAIDGIVGGTITAMIDAETAGGKLMVFFTVPVSIFVGWMIWECGLDKGFAVVGGFVTMFAWAIMTCRCCKFKSQVYDEYANEDDFGSVAVAEDEVIDQTATKTCPGCGTVCSANAKICRICPRSF